VSTDAQDEREGAFGGLRRRLRAPVTFVRLIRRDPHHVPERLTIFAVDRQAAAAHDWAERARERSRAATADDQLRRTIATARVDGAIAGTPFFIALVPAYVAFLLQEVRLHLRVAALYGHDPADPRVAGEFLVLRGVRPDVDAAVAELEKVRATPLPPRPAQRTPIRSWYRAVVNVLVLAGFLGAPDEDEARDGGRWRRIVDAIRFIVAGFIWALTWIFPLTFMIVMSWACESDARRFGGRVIAQYRPPGEEAVFVDKRGHRALDVARAAIVVLSVAIPLAFVGAAIANGKGPLGIDVPDAAAALAALALVIGVSVAALRG
jgi:hypothetical protein